MLPPDGILVGALRWLDLLQRNTIAQAWSFLANDARYTDLTRTQYHTSLDWLARADLLIGSGDTLNLAPSVRHLQPKEAASAVMAKALALDAPPWLPDSDVLIHHSDDLPHDAERLATALNLDEATALNAVRRAQHKVDLQARATVGATGETALLELLESRWPDSTAHVAAHDDTAGYDIAFDLENITWHLEVKTTNRRGRLVIYLSRHEFVTAMTDPAWRLVTVGIDSDGRLVVLATVRTEDLCDRAPINISPTAGWDSARYSFGSADLLPGLRLTDPAPTLVLPWRNTFAWAPPSP